MSSMTSKATGAGVPCCGYVRMAHGIAVHGRVVAWRIVAARQHVLGEYAASSFKQRDALRAEDL